MTADSAAKETTPSASVSGDIDSLELQAAPVGSVGQVRELLAFLKSWDAPEQELLALEGDGDAPVIPVSGSSTWRTLENPPTGSTPSASSGEEKPHAAAAAAAPLKKRVHRRDEITQLREEASGLEKTLSDLNEYWKSVRAQANQQRIIAGGGDEMTTCSSAMISRSSAAERNANRERRLRSAAEEENRKLRDEYRLRRKNAKAFQKLLRRRAATNLNFNCVLQLMLHPTTPQQVLARSGEVFQNLLHGLSMMSIERAHIDRVIESRRRPTCTFRDWNVREDVASAEGIFLELMDSSVLPFDRLQVNKAMYKLYSEHTSSSRHFCEYVHFNANEDTIVRQSIYAYSNADGDGHVRHQEVMRNESDDTHSLFLRITRIQPVGATGKPISGLSLLEKQWTVIRTGGDGDDRKDGEASSSSSSSPFSAGGGALSIVQSYHKITLVAVDKKYEGAWTPSTIMDAIVPAWDASRTKTRRRLEAHLIEQGMRSRRRLQAAEVR